MSIDHEKLNQNNFLEQLKQRIIEKGVQHEMYIHCGSYCAIGHLLSLKGMPDDELETLRELAPSVDHLLTKRVPRFFSDKFYSINDALVNKANSILLSTNISPDNLIHLQTINDNANDPEEDLIEFITSLQQHL